MQKERFVREEGLRGPWGGENGRGCGRPSIIGEADMISLQNGGGYLRKKKKLNQSPFTAGLFRTPAQRAGRETLDLLQKKESAKKEKNKKKRSRGGSEGGVWRRETTRHCRKNS